MQIKTIGTLVSLLLFTLASTNITAKKKAVRGCYYKSMAHLYVYKKPDRKQCKYNGGKPIKNIKKHACFKKITATCTTAKLKYHYCKPVDATEASEECTQNEGKLELSK